MFIASSQMIENLIIILNVYKQYIEQTYMYIKTKKHVRVMLRIYTVIFFIISKQTVMTVRLLRDELIFQYVFAYTYFLFQKCLKLHFCKPVAI